MLHEIQELTKNGQGYIYWKEIHVEHFSYPVSEMTEEAEASRKLAERCRQLENWKFPVNSQTVAWRWTWFAGWDSLSQTEQNLYHLFFEKGFCWHENSLGDMAFVINDEFENKTCEVAIWKKDKQEFETKTAQYRSTQVCWHALDELGFAVADMKQNGEGEKLGTVYASTSGVISFIKRHNLDEKFFSSFEKYLTKNKE